MKNIKYLIFGIVFLFVNIFCVHASCTDDEINLLKEDINKIKITYKHKGAVEIDDDIYYNYFKLNIMNMPDDFYVLLSKNTNKLIPSQGEIETTVYSGTWDVNVYSNKCNEKIGIIEVLIPTFNMYSLDPLCEGIDGNDFALCGKYYEYYVSYDDFVNRVNYYRTIHNVVGADSDEKNDEKNDQKIVNDIWNNILIILVDYNLDIVIGLIVILIILLFIMRIMRRKKRGVLE